MSGAGTIGRVHIDAIRQIADGALSAIVDPDVAIDRLALAAGVPRFDSLDALLARQRPDALILATPNQLHLQQALQCIDAGVPFLLEKPLAATVAEGRTLVDAVQRVSQVRVLVGHHRAHSPIMTAARKAIDRNVLGTPVAVTGSALFLQARHLLRPPRPGAASREGGPILINLIHEIHNLARAVRRDPLGSGILVPGGACIARGGHGGHQPAFRKRCPGHLHAVGYGGLGTQLGADQWREPDLRSRHRKKTVMLVSGTRGSLAIPTMRLTRYATGAECSWHTPFERAVIETAAGDPIVLQMQHFARVVRGEAEPLVSVQDALTNLQVIDAVVKAAACGQVVDVDTIE